MTGIEIPGGGGSGLEGMQATIQVVTNGDPDGGLYNCADVTLSARYASLSSLLRREVGRDVMERKWANIEQCFWPSKRCLQKRHGREHHGTEYKWQPECDEREQ
jgi:hypothetical protein